MTRFSWFFAEQRFSRITAQFIAFHMVLTTLIALLMGPSNFISFTGVFLILFLDSCLVASLVFGARGVEILLTTNWFIIMFVLPRLTAFQLFPASTINFVAMEPFAPDEVNRGVVYFSIGYVMIWAGIWSASKLCTTFFRRSGSSQKSESRNGYLPGIVLFSLLTFAGSFYVTHVLGVSIFSANPEDWGNRMGWIARVFDTDMALLLTVVWLVAHPNETRKKRFIAMLLLALWLLISMDGGSRGGALRIIILVGLASFALLGDPRTSVKQVLGLILASYLGSMVIFPVATVLRMIPTSGAAATANLAKDWYKTGSAQEIDPWPLREMLSKSPAFVFAAASFSPIVTRLGLIDYPIEIVSRSPLHPEAVEHYLSLKYSLKNFANNMVPGEIFPDADIMTSRVFTMTYRDYDEKHVRTAFLSEPWTLWGMSWIQGGPIGGLVIIFGLAFFVQIGLMVIQGWRSGYSGYAAAAYLFVPVLSGFLQVFGIDHWLTITAHFSISFIAAMVVIRITDLLQSRIFPQPHEGEQEDRPTVVSKAKPAPPH